MDNPETEATLDTRHRTKKTQQRWGEQGARDE